MQHCAEFERPIVRSSQKARTSWSRIGVSENTPGTIQLWLVRRTWRTRSIRCKHCLSILLSIIHLKTTLNIINFDALIFLLLLLSLPLNSNKELDFRRYRSLSRLHLHTRTGSISATIAIISCQQSAARNIGQRLQRIGLRANADSNWFG